MSQRTSSTTTHILLSPPHNLEGDLLKEMSRTNKDTKNKFDTVLQIPFLRLVKVDEGTIYPIITKAYHSSNEMFIMNTGQMRKILTYSLNLITLLPVVAKQQLTVKEFVNASGSMVKRYSEESQRELEQYTAFFAKFSADIDSLKSSLNQMNENLAQLKLQLERQETRGSILEAIKRALGSSFSFHNGDSSVGDLLNMPTDDLTVSVDQMLPHVKLSVIQKLNLLIETNSQTHEKVSDLSDSLQLSLDLSSRLINTWPQIESDYTQLAKDASLFPTSQVDQVIQAWTRVKNEAESFISTNA